ncbi:hypothetical protein AB205_0144690 [Aquarana catesbeiana]|uniref:Endoplasmic reticulum lectin n=1 Tax=Aquarana catesbeiana TaxID=8400 RepID=A0A2G9RSC9_AQUCT|nr:hypothetical protein AB205_0144690 [Aquarana catesbeiana]
MCEEGSGDYIARVDEPQSCTYVLTIHTTRICNHPFLRPPSTGTPQSIRCHPALSPEQYVEYVKAQVSDTKRIVEELSEELKTLDLNTLPNKGSASLDQENPLNIAETAEGHPQEESVEDSAAAEIDEGGTKLEQEEAEIWNKISQPQDAETQMSDTEPTEGVFPNHNPTEGAQGTHKTLRYRIIRNQEDLMKFIQDLKKPEKDEDKLVSESKEAQTEIESSAVDELKNAEDEDEQALMQEFEKELENFLLPKSDVSQIKDNVKTEMEKEFNNIIDEVITRTYDNKLLRKPCNRIFAGICKPGAYLSLLFHVKEGLKADLHPKGSAALRTRPPLL